MEIKVSKYDFLRENFRASCEKFIESYIRNLERKNAKFDCSTLLFGFRNALRIAYDEISQEREIAIEKAAVFDRDDKYSIGNIFNNKKDTKKNFFDEGDKICYEFIKKEIGVWRIYGYMPEKEYLATIFENSLGKFLTKIK
ncbi:MAG: hypothetical protein QXY62_01655 [Candidatus Altiarchaeota archaeon]